MAEQQEQQQLEQQKEQQIPVEKKEEKPVLPATANIGRYYDAYQEGSYGRRFVEPSMGGRYLSSRPYYDEGYYGGRYAGATRLASGYDEGYIGGRYLDGGATRVISRGFDEGYLSGIPETRVLGRGTDLDAAYGRRYLPSTFGGRYGYSGYSGYGGDSYYGGRRSISGGYGYGGSVYDGMYGGGFPVSSSYINAENVTPAVTEAKEAKKEEKTETSTAVTAQPVQYGNYYDEGYAPQTYYGGRRFLGGSAGYGGYYDGRYSGYYPASSSITRGDFPAAEFGTRRMIYDEQPRYYSSAGTRVLTTGEREDILDVPTRRVLEAPRPYVTGSRMYSAGDRYYGSRFADRAASPQRYYDAPYEVTRQQFDAAAPRDASRAARALDAADGVIDGKFYGSKIVERKRSK